MNHRKDDITISFFGVNDKMELNPFTLSFSGEWADMEQSFIDEYFLNSLTPLRFALLMGIFFYAVFGILDALLLPQKKQTLWLFRYVIVCPSLAAVFLFSFSSNFKKFMQPSISLLMIISGMGIITMIVISPPPVNYAYYAGLILVFIFGYTFVRARFIWATTAGWIIVALYEISAAWISKTPAEVLVNNNFFFISANIHNNPRF